MEAGLAERLGPPWWVEVFFCKCHKKSPKRTGLGPRSYCLRLVSEARALELATGLLRQSRDLGEPRPSSWINTATMRVFQALMS